MGLEELPPEWQYLVYLEVSRRAGRRRRAGRGRRGAKSS